MSSNPFTNPNILYELLLHNEYPAIRKICSSDQKNLFYCLNDPLIKELINQKRIIYKTDIFLQQLAYRNDPIINVVILNDVEMLDELLKRGYDPTNEDNYPIRLASEQGYLNIVNLLLQDPRVDPSASDNYALQFASANGHLGVINRLLEDSRVDPSASDNNAIQSASLNGHLSVVNRLLQESDVDPSDEYNRAIQLATNVHVIDRLLQDPRVDPTANYNYAIRYAFTHRYYDAVNRLLQDERVRRSLSHENLQKYTKLRE